MTWTNAFDVGECRVIVMRRDTSSGPLSTLSDAVMVKGGSITIDVDNTVSVSADGLVSYDGPVILGSGGAVALRVIPASAPASDCRVGSILIDLGIYADGSGLGVGNYADQSSAKPISYDGSNWTPDPCALETGATELSIVATSPSV